MNPGKDNTEPDSSGYVESLDEELKRVSDPMQDNAFTSLRPLYESNTGVSLLYTAVRFGKRFTLKCLKPEFRDNPLYRRALYKEFEIGYALDHPNIRATIGYEDLPGLGQTIVLEFIDGETLEELTDRGAVSAEVARKLTAQLAGAVGYLHRKQMLHRDIKPCNVMVSYSSQTLKLMDFSLSDNDSFTVLKAQAGTRSYMAPEQLRESKPSSVKTDIYAFGLVTGALAQASGDKLLNEVASLCTAADESLRPASLDGLGLDLLPEGRWRGQRQSILDSKWLTALLIAVILLSLLTLIATL